MLFEFTSNVEAGIKSGKYVEVFSNGISIGIVCDSATGQFVGYAVSALVNNNLVSPLITPVQFLMKGANMVQTYIDIDFQKNYQQNDFIRTGLQSLQTNLGVLQATTALIGVGTVATVALKAVNLHQVLKFRREVQQMRLEVKNGFINLSQAVKDQEAEIRQIVEQIVQDVNFEQHRIVLVRAYTLFVQAINRLQSVIQLKDFTSRNDEIVDVRKMLLKALADYTNPHLLEEISALGQIRRFECAWAIEQAIVITYQVQNEMSAVSECLWHLRDKISEHSCIVIGHCESYDDLDFLFPEISRIRNHDFAILEIWQARVDWMRSLSKAEIKLLVSSDFNTLEPAYTLDVNLATEVLAVPPEQLAYEYLTEKAHFYSLRDQLMFMFKPYLRCDYEVYIKQQASVAGYKTLASNNLQKVSDLAVTNLYYYFKVRDESNIERTLEAVIPNSVALSGAEKP
ncbi:MAG: hypothetical protein HWQ43_09730 [Nostoc sp. JL31]|uniref:hypothetical protein n=1 Tax=Nostoc sp. JL31 TaxID=2815395 RepID=UPI0025ECF1D5|nr:hypothetical protein [Nostoc sp. JL31]MBN3889430.1 hypothetical protein [Nostoc sp. JL31]